MAKRHNQPFFYKYMTAETALKVINSQSFRWSSPLLFNDPFDHQIEFSLPFTGKELSQAIGAEMESIIYNEKAYIPRVENRITQALGLFSSMKQKLERETYRRGVESTLKQIEESFEANIEKIKYFIVDHFCHSRIFCVSETKENIAMWAYYAGDHSGVVMQLKCIEDIDNPLMIAEKVNYTDQLLSFISLDEYVQDAMGECSIDWRILATKIITTKHIHWSHEREWRVSYPLLTEPAGDGYMYLEENSKVFGAVYLGCRMSKENEELIRQSLAKYLPNVEVYKAEKSRKAFALEFIRA